MDKQEIDQAVLSVAGGFIDASVRLVRKVTKEGEDPLILSSIVLQALNTAAVLLTGAIFETLEEEDAWCNGKGAEGLT